MLKDYLTKIDEEIITAENGPATNSNAVYLAALHILKKCYTDHPDMITESCTEQENNSLINTEFLTIIKNKDVNKVINKLAEYFEVVKITDPHSYMVVINSLRQI